MAKVGALAGASTIVGSPLDVTIPSRHELFTGMEYEMDYNTRRMDAPQNAPPVARSSLAQMILIHRYQQSKYLSILRYFGLRPDYPAFHGFKIVNGAPVVSNSGQPIFSSGYPGLHVGTVSPFPRARTAGTMRPVSRFVKALPVPIPQYNAPTYPIQE